MLIGSDGDAPTTQAMPTSAARVSCPPRAIGPGDNGSPKIDFGVGGAAVGAAQRPKSGVSCLQPARRALPTAVAQTAKTCVLGCAHELCLF